MKEAGHGKQAAHPTEAKPNLPTSIRHYLEHLIPIEIGAATAIPSGKDACSTKTHRLGRPIASVHQFPLVVLPVLLGWLHATEVDRRYVFGSHELASLLPWNESQVFHPDSDLGADKLTRQLVHLVCYFSCLFSNSLDVLRQNPVILTPCPTMSQEMFVSAPCSEGFANSSSTKLSLSRNTRNAGLQKYIAMAAKSKTLKACRRTEGLFKSFGQQMSGTM